MRSGSKMLIGVVGDNAQELGGYRTHNPFRLYCRTRFKNFIQALPEAEVLVALRPGVGQWLAEVCNELRRPFGVVKLEHWPPAWPVNVREALDHLVSRASRVLLAKDVNAHVREEVVRHHENPFAQGGAMCFVAVSCTKVSGSVRAIMNALDAAGVAVAPLYPESLPTSFAALGCIEEAREAVPDSLSARMRVCAERLRSITKAPDAALTEKQLAAIVKRAEQAELIADLADVFCKRAVPAATG